MLKGSDTVGIPITVPNQKTDEKLEDWILDLRTNKVLGFVVTRGGWQGGTRILLWENVASISKDSLVTAPCSPIIEINKIIQVKKVMENPVRVIGLEVITRSGDYVGQVRDFYFDENSGTLLRLITSAPKNANSDGDYTFVPVFEPLRITNHLIVATREMMDGIEHSPR